MIALDASRRAALERAVVKARKLLEQDFAAQAEGRFGIYPDGTIDEESALSLSQSELTDRREILEVLNHLQAQGESSNDPFDRLVREAAFTHLNRLFAIRVAEAIGLLQPSLSDGRGSVGFREVLEVAPLLSADPTGGYWTYLRLCGDELAADAPVLFDPRNPLLSLAPSPSALDELVALLSDKALTEAWTAPDAFGWAYQFFNTAEERRQMREAGAPRNSRELAVRNQFFTPRYVVDFLVHNSLGRRLMEAEPDSVLKEKLHLLIDPPEERGKPLDLEDVKCLDPACGSGHFLLGCYDVLEEAWGLQGLEPGEAAPRILRTLWGIDIDPRCAQVCSAALVLRARRHRREGGLPRPNIITARALPDDPEVWERILTALPQERRSLISSLKEALEQAPVLGSLLKVEERLASDIRSAVGVVRGADDLFTAMGVADDAFGRAEADVLEAIQRVADETVSTAAERLFAAEASDAIRFVDAMRQRYDTVLMNPPFGEPIPETRDYLKSAYGWMPKRDVNLLAAFVGRGLELCREGGYVGAITSRAGMFLTTFEAWRREILLGHQLVTLADLGFGVMEQALVEAAAYVIGADHEDNDQPASFVRLLRDTNRPAALAEALSHERNGITDKRVFRVTTAELDTVPGSPVAYWMAPSVRRLFADLAPIEGNGAEVRQGLATADDFRFVRAFWEVDASAIARSRAETLKGRRWVPFAKGGDYSPYWSDIFLVVDWGKDGEAIKQHIDRRYPYLKGKVEWVAKNTDYYFRRGLTWPRRTNSGFGIRVLPAGTIFADKGSAAFPLEAGVVELLAWLRTRLVQALLDTMVAAGEETTSGGASRSYEVGLVQRLPWPGALLDEATRSKIRILTESVATARAHLDARDETTRRFIAPLMPVKGEGIESAAQKAISEVYQAHLRMIDQAHEVEGLLHHVLDLGEEAKAYLDDEIGRHPASYGEDPEFDEERFARLFVTSVDKMIDEVVAERGGSRAIANLTYIADRRLEVLAHAFECHPRVLSEIRDRLGLLPPEEPRRSAANLVSYLVGAAFGRWDVRFAKDQQTAALTPELVDPVPLHAPGMLVMDGEMTGREVPSTYPLELPPDGLLLDEPGHRWDLETCCKRAAVELFDDADEVLSESAKIFGQRNLGGYFRRQFFKDHLGRYTKSRRKAPIYWHLSVPSRNWGVWLYAPTLSRETLFAIEREAERRFVVGQELVRSLQAERDAGGRGRTSREVNERLAAEETLAEELRAFRMEAKRVANLGWEPDLNDGIILCAAPLSSLFPAWPEAAKERENLRKGKYEWATVAQWRNDL